MTGQIRTWTRNFTSTGSQQSVMESFVTFVEYFNSHPNFQQIASNYGTGGQGFGNSYLFSGSCGEQAFAVYRAVSSSIIYDIAFTWSYNNTYTPTRWTDPSVNYGLGMQLAWHSSSQAWSGTTGNTGSDVFFTNNRPWKSGSIVFPRVNGSGGATATNKNGVLKIVDAELSNNLWQITIIGDDDTTHAFFQNAQESQQGTADKLFSFGKYIPFTSSYTLPLMVMSYENFDNTATIGSTSDGNMTSTRNGGLSYTSASDCRSFRINFPIYAPERTPRIAKLILNEENTRAYIYPIVLTSFETSHYNMVGILSGVYVTATNVFGNIQDVSRSFVGVKMPNGNINNLSLILPFTGSTDFFLKGTFE